MFYFEPLQAYVSSERNVLHGAPGDREPAATGSFRAQNTTKPKNNRLIQLGSELVSWRWLQPDTALEPSPCCPAPPHARTHGKMLPVTPSSARAGARCPTAAAVSWRLKFCPHHYLQREQPAQDSLCHVSLHHHQSSCLIPPTRYPSFVTPHGEEKTGISISALGWIQFMR